MMRGITFVLAGLVVMIAAGGCQKEPSYGSPAAPSGAATPAEFAKGEALFNAHCAACHGEKAAGTDHGPPFIDRIYEPHHHADATFQLAARNGVRSHHWTFGNMPPVEGVTESDVNEIIGYVRWLQRQAGIS